MGNLLNFFQFLLHFKLFILSAFVCGLSHGTAHIWKPGVLSFPWARNQAHEQPSSRCPCCWATSLPAARSWLKAGCSGRWRVWWQTGTPVVFDFWWVDFEDLLYFGWFQTGQCGQAWGTPAKVSKKELGPSSPAAVKETDIYDSGKPRERCM